MQICKYSFSDCIKQPETTFFSPFLSSTFGEFPLHIRGPYCAVVHGESFTMRGEGHVYAEQNIHELKSHEIDTYGISAVDHGG